MQRSRNAGSESINLPGLKVVVERDDLVRGFELSKENYVQITEEAEANNGIEFREVPRK
jgi:non-homologous end joining protein Ku